MTRRDVNHKTILKGESTRLTGTQPRSPPSSLTAYDKVNKGQCNANSEHEYKCNIRKTSDYIA